ncbi:MAG: carboxypeptidase-like regulatory domain-containing protein, partial [Alistipes sp.]|nr:carboxypeptidase-like regulatory domain-containing protein [Alistipes sp.]
MKYLYGVVLTLLVASAVSAHNNRPTDAHLFGHVVESRTKNHVPYATIVLAGTTIGTTTDATGHFLIKNLPFGDYTVEVRALGYATQRQEVCLHNPGTVEVNFEVEEEAVSVDQVVVSANR